MYQYHTLCRAGIEEPHCTEQDYSGTK